jgi:Ser/Thr protein kinase RdoA (MazF antagonist)
MSDAVAQRPETLPDDLRALARPPHWLRAAADGSELASALTRRVPEIASGELELRGCDVDRVRIKSDGCSARYRVGVSSGGAGPERIVELHGELIPPGRPQPRASASAAFGEAGWRRWVPELRMMMTTEPPDTVLEAMPALTDAQVAPELVERAIRTASPRYASFRAGSYRPHVARYKPGSRCTVVYDLELSPGAPEDWPRSVVAKTYHGDKGRTAFDGMRALWASPLRQARVAIAEPLGFLPAERVLVQRVIPHRRTLKDLLRSSLASGSPEALADLRSTIEETAHGLGALHRSGVQAAQRVAWGDQVAETREVIGRLAALVPALAGSAQSFLDDAARIATAHPAQAAVPAHGSFRPAQVVLDDAGGIGFIDFDGFCLAEPAMDVAQFCATLRDVGLRALENGPQIAERGDRRDTGLARLDAECACFVAAYEQAAGPISTTRVGLWETMYALVAVLHCWTKVKFDRLPYRLSVLRRRLPEAEA